MNYVVITLYRVTNNLEMTYLLTYKLFSNERLTSIFLDQTAVPMHDMCNKLKIYINAYLPKLGQAMQKAGVETDYFAQTWFITMLFHF